MKAALDDFIISLAHVRNVGGVYGSIKALTTPALDLSDLLRTQLVMCVSALDRYVHEVTRLGMLATLAGKRPPTDAFQKYEIALGSVSQATAALASDAWLDTEIRTRHGYLSFQQPEKIADAIRLISSVELWNALGAKLKQPPKALKTELQLIVSRRNQIVHEADVDPTYAGSGDRWPITAPMVNDAVVFIERLVITLHGLL